MPSHELLDVYHSEVQDRLTLDPAAYLRMRYFPRGRATMQGFAIALHQARIFKSDLGRHAALSALVKRELASSLDLTAAEYRALRVLLFPQGVDHDPDETWAAFLQELEAHALAGRPPRRKRKESGDGQA